MSVREKLPERRKCIVIDVRYPRGTASRTSVQVGFYEDWRVGEIFIAGYGKQGSALDTEARNWAITASIALQHGVPLDLMFHASLKTHEGQPDGIAGVVLEAVMKLQGEFKP